MEDGGEIPFSIFHFPFLVLWRIQFTGGQFTGGGGHGPGRRPMRRPQIRMIRHGRILGVEPLRRHVQQAKSLARHPRNDFGRHPAPRPCFAHTQQPPGARHARHHRIGVQRLDRAQVHHFDFPAFRRQFLRRFQRLLHHRAVGHNRQVPALARNARLANRQRFGRQLVGLRW